jgi:hypothetical protein
MKRFLFLLAFFPVAFAAVPACSSSTPGAGGSSGTSGTPDSGALPDEDAGPGGATQCTAARKTHLLPLSKVSTADVKVVSTEGDVTTLYIDASAGGVTEAPKTPRVYIKLSGERVDISDNAAFDSADWDLALKRVDIYTNSGDAGPGKGGAVLVQKDFADVTAADATDIAAEKVFDEECKGLKDEAEFILTSFTGWYDYKVGGTGPSAKPGITFVVRAADGTTKYKVGIVTYTGQSDGGVEGPAGGYFILKVAKL